VQRLQAALHAGRARRVAIVLGGEAPGEYIGLEKLPVLGKFGRIALEERAHVLMLQTILLPHKILRFAGAVGEQFGAAGVVGGVADRTEDEFIEAMLVEPVRYGKNAMERAAARRGDGFGEFGQQFVDKIVAAGISGDCQCRDGAVGRQRAIDLGAGSEREHGNGLQGRMLRGRRRQLPKPARWAEHSAIAVSQSKMVMASLLSRAEGCCRRRR